MPQRGFGCATERLWLGHREVLAGPQRGTDQHRNAQRSTERLWLCHREAVAGPQRGSGWATERQLTTQLIIFSSLPPQLRTCLPGPSRVRALPPRSPSTAFLHSHPARPFPPSVFHFINLLFSAHPLSPSRRPSVLPRHPRMPPLSLRPSLPPLLPSHPHPAYSSSGVGM